MKNYSEYLKKALLSKEDNSDDDDSAYREIADTLTFMDEYITETFKFIHPEMKAVIIEHYRNEKYNAPLFQDIISELDDMLQQNNAQLNEDEEEL